MNKLRTVTLTPDIEAILSRPVNGQGGFQSLLRKLQTEWGIVPRMEATIASPRDMRPSDARNSRSTAAVRVPATTPAASGLLADIAAMRNRLLRESEEISARGTEIAAALAAFNGSTPASVTSTDAEAGETVAPRKRRKVRMTAARKARYSEASKARWAARKAEQAQIERATKRGKRK